MPHMLPALTPGRLSLADVLPSCLAALEGTDNPLELPAVDRVLVIVVDGLGHAQLRAAAGHARYLAPLAAASIDSVFPTTTASALSTLATGTRPGRHGLVGYTALDAAHDRVVNQLTGWDDEMRPEVWQRQPTVWEAARAEGITVSAVGPAKYVASGFTRAVLRGADYHAAGAIVSRLQMARTLLAASPRALVYLYVPELDAIGHAKGVESAAWTDALEDLDRELREAVPGLPASTGVLITADHGQITVPPHGHVLFDLDPELIDGVRHVGGEPRCLHLYFEPGLSPADRERIKQAWIAAESSRAWIADRDEVIESGWMGPVDAEVAPRIGDLVIAARKRVAYYDSRADPRARGMVGQHGSLTAEELRVPLIRLGAFRSA